MASTGEASKTSTSSFRKYHEGIRPSDWDPSRLTWKVALTREKTDIVDKDNNKVTVEEAWGLEPCYKYSDGKTDTLGIAYDVAPMAVMESTTFGRERKVVLIIHRERGMYPLLKKMETDIRDSCVDAMFTQDCSKVIGSIAVPDDKFKPLKYRDFIGKWLKEPNDSALEAIMKRFKDKIMEDWKPNSLIYESEDRNKNPSKWLSITKYPKGPKSQSVEDIAKYERQKVEGYIKLNIWCDDEVHKMVDPHLDAAVWVEGKTGKRYTTDYHLYTHKPKGMDPWVGVNTIIKCVRISIAKKAERAGEISFVLDEEAKGGVLGSLRVSERVERTDSRLKDYKEEFADEHPDAVSRLRPRSDLHNIADGDEVLDDDN